MLGEEHLKNMETILEKGAEGTHVLFDNGVLAEILSQPKDDHEYFNEETMGKVQELMTALLARKGYYEKLAFLNALDRDTFEIMVRSYFHMVEHAAFQSSSVRH